ncbi:DNA-binding transcriptional MerR regulator [Murinocardiopsis flavida]|uniref:DNA-binding transcriptional MerR regulator n=1 Tax=Murinocardiopsis flavida TaxID=645275 RepID=A0A2P8CUX8_9ACTN|nr:MerR family transcriptional regulator [Murinocardiopsis flavida]PSK88784.1 DNA-binding transcriptional MerR regulator [Murinocardiopsis flavida]
MAWSTRELADLAGTTIKAIRHYHDIDLIEEPERALNGYKRYTTRHLVRLLQIRRLRKLGMSLAQIAAMDGPGDGFADTVRTLDAELAASIERQQGIRAELADLLRHHAAADVPPGFEAVASSLSDADRAMIMVSSRLFGDEVMQDMQDMSTSHQDADAEFNGIPADADAAAVRDLAERFAPVVRSIRAQYPSARDPGPFALGRERDAMVAVAQALSDLYNPAQVAVLQQVHRILADDPRPDGRDA